MMLQKVKAGALQLTMFIVIIIALLLSAFILLIHTHNRFKIQTNFVLETVDNASKGIDYMLQNDIRLDDTIQVNLHTENHKAVKVYRDYWGLFGKVVSIATTKTNTFRKTALMGGLQSQKDRTALYVEEQNKPLVLVGNTRVEGLTYLPKQGVRTGNISGHSYYGSQLIYGDTKESGKLPKILNKTLEHLKTTQNQIEGIHPNQFLDLNRTRTYRNSFLSPVQIIYSKKDMVLSNVSLTGHILIQSRTKIIVEANASLTDVVLIAPEIDIKSKSRGTFQAIATKGLNIGQNCILNYPSALVLIEDTKQIQNISNNIKTPFIKVGKGSDLKGVIAYLGRTENYKAQVFIDDSVTIRGEVYCSRNLELLGKVYGSVFTSGFVANQSGSVYQNHLYNATIAIDGLPQDYVGLMFENQEKGVIKWLY